MVAHQQKAAVLGDVFQPGGVELGLDHKDCINIEIRQPAVEFAVRILWLVHVHNGRQPLQRQKRQNGQPQEQSHKAHRHIHSQASVPNPFAPKQISTEKIADNTAIVPINIPNLRIFRFAFYYTGLCPEKQAPEHEFFFGVEIPGAACYNRQENALCRLLNGEERKLETMGIALTAPWRAYYGNTPASLDYPRLTMYQMVAETAKKYPKTLAYTFMGKGTTYEEFVQRIDRAAKGLVLGIRKGQPGDHLYAQHPSGVGLLLCPEPHGAIPNMIHPLSAAQEIAFYLNASHSKAVLTLDQFYGKVAQILPQLDDDCKVIIAKIADELPFP